MMSFFKESVLWTESSKPPVSKILRRSLCMESSLKSINTRTYKVEQKNRFHHQCNKMEPTNFYMRLCQRFYRNSSEADDDRLLKSCDSISNNLNSVVSTIVLRCC